MIFTIIYLVGVIIAYLLNRWIDSDKWTVKRRTISILLSLLSWIDILFELGYAVYMIIKSALNNENKAKW